MASWRPKCPWTGSSVSSTFPTTTPRPATAQVMGSWRAEPGTGEEGTVAPWLPYTDAAKRSQRQQNLGRAGGHFLGENPQTKTEADLALGR